MTQHNPLFPIDETNYTAWKNKSVEELYEIQAKLIAKMDSVDYHRALEVYAKYDDLMQQLDSMIVEKMAEKKKEEAKSKVPYNVRKD